MAATATPTSSDVIGASFSRPSMPPFAATWMPRAFISASSSAIRSPLVAFTAAAGRSSGSRAIAVRPSSDTSAVRTVVPGTMPSTLPASARNRSIRSATAGEVAPWADFQTMSRASPERPANFCSMRSAATWDPEPGVL